jgi:hypothetical protein
VTDDLEDALSIAKENIARDGYLAPILLVTGDNDNAVIGFEDFGPTPKERQKLLFETGKRLAAQLLPTCVTLVCDAYWKMEPVGAPERNGLLVDDPGAEECILVASLGLKVPYELLICPYERTSTLEGERFEFKEPRRTSVGAGRAYILEAFFHGVVAGFMEALREGRQN